MRIVEAELREIHLQLQETFTISSGGWRERRILLLRLVAEEGEVWSECVAAEHPNYSYETPDTAWHILTRYVLPAVVGRTFEGPHDVLEPVAWIRGHPMALAAVEMGTWALRAQAGGVSLSALLGGRAQAVPVGVSIGLQDSDHELLRTVERHLEAGYKRIKLKIRPGRDVDMLWMIRSRFPEAPLMVDANAAYTQDSLDRIVELDSLGLLMIEQPLGHEDYLQHAQLQARLTTPLCLDESIRSPGDAELALYLGSCRVVNVKPGRVGGFRPSLAIRDVCTRAGVPVWCGGMLESGVGRAYNLALASTPGFTLPGDISESRRYWVEDVVEPEFVMERGMMPVPQGPGIGVRVREDRLEGLTRRCWLKKA